MSKTFNVEDAVWLCHTQIVGDEIIEWDEIGIIQEINEKEGMAWVSNHNGDEFDIPLNQLIAYDN